MRSALAFLIAVFSVSDVPSNKVATELIAWTADYGFRTKDEEIALLNKNKHLHVHTITSRQEMNEYLEKLAKSK